MKTVGKQLEEARLARKLTPEAASRETKIKLDRLLDLEADNFANFSSPAYARGFVRTYARSLGLDEYKILRQLDHKLPDDNASISIDSGVTYVPQSTEISTPMQANRVGGNILWVLAAVIVLIGIFIAIQNYRATVLTQSTPDNSETKTDVTTSTTNSPSTNVAAPVAAPVDTAPAAKALPVVLPGGIQPPTDVPPPKAVPALPVDPNSIPVAPKAAVSAVPAVPADASSSPDASSTPAVARALPVSAADLGAVPVVSPPANSPGVAPVAPVAASKPIELKLIPQGVSFVNVTELNEVDGTAKLLYAGVLRQGDVPLTFTARRYKVTLGIPSAVTVLVDGANFSHSTGSTSESFTLPITQ